MDLPIRNVKGRPSGRYKMTLDRHEQYKEIQIEEQRGGKKIEK